MLSSLGRRRYKEKLAILGGITDPYLTMEQNQDSLEWQDWSEVQYPDIYNYLVATPSPHLSMIPSSVSNLLTRTPDTEW